MTGPDPAMLDTYFRLMNANGVAQAYHAALEQGVLSALQSGPLASEQVAAACDARVRPVALLLEALSAIGVVRKDAAADTYSLTTVAHLLLGSEYRELGNPYWRHLPAFLRTAEPVRKMDDASKSEEYYQSQAAILGWMLTPAAEAAAAMLASRAGNGGLAILDVGAGSAVWSLRLARHHPQSRVTAVDWPAVLEVAAENAAELGLSDRLATIAGNCHEVDLPDAAFDVAIVANVTHLQTPEQNASLFRKIHAALKPAGELVVVDAFPGSPAGNAPFALYHLGLALRTENGRVYSAPQLQAMMDEQQYEPGELFPLDAPPHMVGMLVCRKLGAPAARG